MQSCVRIYVADHSALIHGRCENQPLYRDGTVQQCLGTTHVPTANIRTIDYYNCDRSPHYFIPKCDHFMKWNQICPVCNRSGSQIWEDSYKLV